MLLKEHLSALRPTWGNLGLAEEREGRSQFGTVERKRYNSGEWWISLSSCLLWAGGGSNTASA